MNDAVLRGRAPHVHPYGRSKTVKHGDPWHREIWRRVRKHMNVLMSEPSRLRSQRRSRGFKSHHLHAVRLTVTAYAGSPFVARVLHKGGRAAEGAVGSVVVVEALPFLEALVEDLGVLDDVAGRTLRRRCGTTFDLAVEPRGARLDVGMADALVVEVPVEAGTEPGAVVGLDDLDPERELLSGIVDELDRGPLVERS
jgi:hypothetical protein